ncbi:MAG: acylphosphatase [Devosia nanyangense]|uniref:Acylphosphatase n=1 Tax=Devosia nanyangense TaxID=1228055 RepID=A0A933NZY2_9HYPH|nr:acylphosphatase [Devosia nanyangense]
MTRTLQVRISGEVQGVGFRAWTEAAARARGLSGWVRNRRDGSVEALISGENAMVEEMLAYFWQGPHASRVTRVESEPASEPMGLSFRTLPTA